MNCSAFQKIVGEIVNGAPEETSANRAALTHANNCSRCGAILAHERSLNVGLRAFALETETIPNAARLKQSALAAFHAQQNALTTQPQPTEKRAWWQWNWSLNFAGLAVAAILCLAAGAYFFQTEKTTEPPQQAKVEAPQSKAIETVATNNQVEKNLAITTKTIADNVRKNKAQRLVHRGIVKRDGQAGTMNDSVAQTVETTTDYIPLTYAGDERALQNGVVVRLEVPRSTLLAMGAPLNVETKDTTITADVLMGDNGVAYAYRLVK